MTSPQSQQQPTPAHLSLHRSQDHSPDITVWTPTPYKPHLAPFIMLSSSQVLAAQARAQRQQSHKKIASSRRDDLLATGGT